MTYWMDYWCWKLNVLYHALHFSISYLRNFMHYMSSFYNGILVKLGKAGHTKTGETLKMKINCFQHDSWIDIYNMSEDENIVAARVYWTIFCLKMRILILYLDAMTVLKMTLCQNRFRDYIVSHSLLPSLIKDNRISLGLNITSLASIIFH